MYYSLFVSITAFLVLSIWLDTRSALPKGAEVTVEPEGAPAPSPQPAVGSFFATIHTGSSEVGRDVMYEVRRTGVHDTGLVSPTPVARHRLRHRKWHTTAFVGVTNEKRHDGWTTQAMLNWQFAYWQRRSLLRRGEHGNEEDDGTSRLSDQAQKCLHHTYAYPAALPMHAHVVHAAPMHANHVAEYLALCGLVVFHRRVSSGQ